MNYIKKIKSLGFKKIEPIVVCSYQEKIGQSYLLGFTIKTLQDVEKENLNKPNFLKKNYDYPIVSSRYVNRITSYTLKVSDSVSLYLIIVGNEYTFVISDDNVSDKKEGWYLSSEKVTIPIKSEQLSEGFWKKCLSVMDKGIQREILLKNFLK